MGFTLRIPLKNLKKTPSPIPLAQFDLFAMIQIIKNVPSSLLQFDLFAMIQIIKNVPSSLL
jgi:hypothetical protein